jgi:hypothetical protein
VHVDSLPKTVTAAAASSSSSEEQQQQAMAAAAAAAAAPPTYGSMCFCDLAGSERPKETGSSGSTLREAGHINKSLYTLGKVIKSMLR